ncbi:MAG TPA: hypothetical protein VL485_19540 [Ktedonobacteraceae bacterium]|jgi:hypothetical protein|nr:hypothetical protein [Ktedonobacteraceae bacterium]
MHDIAPEVVSIADACLGGLRGRSALLVGPKELCYPYSTLLERAKMKYIYEEETSIRLSSIIPHVQLVISLPAPTPYTVKSAGPPPLTAAMIARGCEGRHTPLLIFDLGPEPSVEELAGLLPAVCLYTPEDLHTILCRVEEKAC